MMTNPYISIGHVLAESERRWVEGYLAWKYGLQGSLPDDHLYKSAPPQKLENDIYDD